MLNKVMLMGNLGRDPEIKFTSGGDAIANLALATSDSWKDKSTGERQSRTEWHRVVVFGKLATVCEQWLHKGSQIYIEGALKTRNYEGSDGVKKYVTEVVLSGFNCRLEMIGGKGETRANPTSSQEPVAPTITPVAKDDFEDDIPF